MGDVASIILVALGASSLALSLHGLFPVRLRGSITVWVGFFASWPQQELPLHLAVVDLVLLGTTLALATPPGEVVGTGLFAAALAAKATLFARGFRARAPLRRALDALGVNHPVAPYPGSHLVIPALAWLRPGAEVRRRVLYAEVAGIRLRLDLWLPRDHRPDRPRPAVIQIHGGAWVVRYKDQQGVPLLGHLARHGFVGIAIDYRLAPRFPLPAAIRDIHRAIAWVREHAGDLGVDPRFIGLTGGSAGGHLTALAALTAHVPALRPRDLTTDTRVDFAVPFYGVFDFTSGNILRSRRSTALLERVVIQKREAEARELYASLSPVHHIAADAPPMLVIHGDLDTITPLEPARTFVARLRTCGARAVLASIPGAGHAFDLIPSVRSAAAVEAVTEAMLHMAKTVMDRKGPPPPRPPQNPPGPDRANRPHPDRPPPGPAAPGRP